MSPSNPGQARPEFRCLILEDDLNVAEVFAQAVNAGGGHATVANTIAQASSLVAGQNFDVFVLDHRLPDGKGSDFFAWVREQGVPSPCIMLTGAPEIQLAVELTRNGLFDYLTKPVDLGHLLSCLHRAVAHGATESNLQGFGLVDASRGMKTVGQLVRQAAANPRTTVLLTGETGVGKDVIARLIHQLTFEQAESSPPMISLNCSTLPADMFEAELFGATKGAYTGAHQNRTGLAEAAQGGTLFLDEIGEVPLSLQAKLLQFLETREYRRLGHTGTLHFEGRIIAATNKSLETEVQAGTFRADLRYRLDVFTIHIPPLRERQEDIVPLVEFLLDTLCRKYERLRPIPKPDDLAALQAYDFPGNVRELRNIVERSLLQTPPDARWLEIDRVCLRRTRVSAPVEKTAPAVRHLSVLDEQEYALIRKTLIEEKGHIRRTATKLDMSHQALLRRLNKWPELRAA
jgi:DNA-binding NtrC family response regulator